MHTSPSVVCCFLTQQVRNREFKTNSFLFLELKEHFFYFRSSQRWGRLTPGGVCLRTLDIPGQVCMCSDEPAALQAPQRAHRYSPFAHAPPAPLPQRPGPGWGCCRACRSARSRENGRKAELCEHQQAFERVCLTLTFFSNFFFSESQPHPCFWGWAGQGSEVKTELTRPRLPAQPPLVFLCLDSALSRLPVHHGVPYGGSHSK